MKEIQITENSNKNKFEDEVKVKEEVDHSFDAFLIKCNDFFEAILKPLTRKELDSLCFNDVRHLWKQFTGQDILPERKKILKRNATEYVTNLLESRIAVENEDEKDEEENSNK